MLEVLVEGRSEDGASAVEYGLIVFAIAAMIVAILWALGGVVSETYSDSCTTIAAKATPSTPSC
jgi:pilus assembly protein Flp/PilA